MKRVLLFFGDCGQVISRFVSILIAFGVWKSFCLSGKRFYRQLVLHSAALPSPCAPRSKRRMLRSVFSVASVKNERCIQKKLCKLSSSQTIVKKVMQNNMQGMGLARFFS